MSLLRLIQENTLNRFDVFKLVINQVINDVNYIN